MTAKEVIDRFSGLGIYEKRCIKNDYVEIVFFNNEITEWSKRVIEIFGSPLKPAGANPNKEDADLTKKHGGIYDNQTLFKKEFDDCIMIAMFWPWQDNKHTTLKIALLPK